MTTTITRPTFEPVEARRLMSAAAFSAQDQLMLELINRARANPAAEAARLDVALNEGLPAGTIADTPRQPLAPSDALRAAADGHVAWLLANDKFSHTGKDGSAPHDRMAAAGYTFGRPSGSGENLAVTLSTGKKPADAAETAAHHRNLFVDEGVEGRGHRVNLLNADWKELGTSIRAGGGYDYNGRAWNAALSGQNFAFTGDQSFLTGVAHTDAVADDDFYTVGEQLAGVTVTATRAADGRSFTATTADAGGYRLALPDGTYRVTAAGGDLGGTVTFENVTIDGQNVKRDFTPDAAMPDGAAGRAAPAWLTNDAGRLVVHGTAGDDLITLYADGPALTVTRNGESIIVDLRLVDSVEVYGNDGDDVVDVGRGVVGRAGTTIGVYLHGGAGDDVLAGNDGHDVLVGDAGRDELNGRGGDDRLDGGAGDDLLMAREGNDRLFGGEGGDRLYAGDGHDRLEGGTGADRLFAGDGNDVLYGGSHGDSLYGQAGDDLMFAGHGDDLLDGGTGADHIDGQQGRDLVTYGQRTRPVKVTVGDDFAAATGDDGEDGERDNVLLTNEILVGGAGDDWLVGSAFSENDLYGNGGNDILDGAAGRRNNLFGGAGDDALFAHDDGFDLLRGGAGADAAWADTLDDVAEVEGVSYRRHPRAA